MKVILDVPRHGSGIRKLRSCVIVCGLHRSGTSAVTRLINLLGVDVAGDLLPGDPHNTRGYWESRAVLDIHTGLLKAVETVHDDTFDPIPLRTDWLTAGAAREAKRRLADAIEKQFADSRLFVVKDPRISRLLPLWLELLQELGIAPIAVIPFRNPLEVAASLAQRDQVSLPKALLLYFHAHLEIELASRAIARVFVRYDDVLQDWRPFARRLNQIAGAPFFPPSDTAAGQIDEFLTADLRHHHFSREQMVRHPKVPAEIVDMFDRMDEAAKTGDEGALRPSFDRLRADLNVATRLYRGFVISELQELRQQLTEMRQSFESSTSWRITAPLRWLKLFVSARDER